MSRDYAKVVLATYEKKKFSGELSPNLLNPTPGTIREECLANYGKDDQSKDDEVFRLFFGKYEGKGGYFQILENSPAEKFRQMPKILNGKVPKPGLKYIELLAWLIDFSPRPITSYHLSLRNNSTNELKADNKLIKGDEGQVYESEKIDNNISNDGKEIERPSSTENAAEVPVVQENTSTRLFEEPQTSIKKLNFFQRIGIVATLGLIMGVAYWKGVPPDGCMYWTGTEYKAVDCDTQIKDAQVIALNQQKLDHFKKITLPDTMTFNSLKKVWYSKINNQVEFFTSKGKHPVNGERILKPVTIYILEKYGNKMLSLTNTHQTDTTEKD